MKKICFLIALCALAAACQKSHKNFELPSLVGDNMVLQQKSDVNVWGKTSPGQKVNISASWNATATAVAGKDGKWTVKLQTHEAGGPFTISISCRDSSIVLNNVMIGEVWFCSGQSNMEMPVEGWPPNDTIMYSAKTIADAKIPGIHLFNVARKVSAEPLEECSGRWEVCTPATVRSFSATAYFFGKKLYDELHVPVGLIESAWGGTPSEAWTSSGALEASGEFVQEIKDIKESAPLQADYQKWLDGHKQLTVGSGENQWKNLDLGDKDVPQAGFDDNSWLTMKLPGLFESVIGDFDGAVWFRKKIEVPDEMAGKDLVLSLGPIDDMDCTYFNGKPVGSVEVSGKYQEERNYDVPKELVSKGENTIAVRVLDTGGGGGIYGKPGSMKLSEKEGSRQSISLEGDWKFLPVAELAGNKFYILGTKEKGFQAEKRPKQVGPSSPATLFNGMVSPVVNYAIKGAIWYQGEANVGRADQYSKIFPVMIQNWRDSWGIKDFPFYFVQIAPYIYSGPDSTESAYLRESQASALKLPNTGMAVTLDIATVNNIHPPFKKEVGERLADLALAKDYGKPVQFAGPQFKSMEKKGKGIWLSFSNVQGSLKAKNGNLTGFEIAGKDGKYVAATAKISGSEVLVSSPKVPDPQSVRYCWHNGSVATLFDESGMPAYQFRTGGK